MIVYGTGKGAGKTRSFRNLLKTKINEHVIDTIKMTKIERTKEEKEGIK